MAHPGKPPKKPYSFVKRFVRVFTSSPASLSDSPCFEMGILFEGLLENTKACCKRSSPKALTLDLKALREDIPRVRKRKG